MLSGKIIYHLSQKKYIAEALCTKKEAFELSSNFFSYLNDLDWLLAKDLYPSMADW